MPSTKPFLTYLMGTISSMVPPAAASATSTASSGRSTPQPASSDTGTQANDSRSTVISQPLPVPQPQFEFFQKSSRVLSSSPGATGSFSLASINSNSSGTSTASDATNTASAYVTQTNSNVSGEMTPGSVLQPLSTSNSPSLNGANSSERWWIGGKASDGQERFYMLQPNRRLSSDRVSIDQLSL